MKISFKKLLLCLDKYFPKKRYPIDEKLEEENSLQIFELGRLLFVVKEFFHNEGYLMSIIWGEAKKRRS